NRLAGEKYIGRLEGVRLTFRRGASFSAARSVSLRDASDRGSAAHFPCSGLPLRRAMPNHNRIGTIATRNARNWLQSRLHSSQLKDFILLGLAQDSIACCASSG